MIQELLVRLPTQEPQAPLDLVPLALQDPQGYRVLLVPAEVHQDHKVILVPQGNPAR